MSAVAARSSSSTGNPLDALANFAAGLGSDGLPPEGLRVVARAVVDYLGVAIAGAGDEQVKSLAAYARQTYRAGEATPLTGGSRLVAEGAAYVNGAAGHVLDFDDYNEVLGGHPTAVIFPAVLALAEARDLDAREAMAAYVIGFEVAIALGRSLNYTHYERGWHPTATLGIFGATVAASRLIGLDAEATRRALSIAASFASGIKGNFGTFAKPLQVGFAAGKGVQSAHLAALGLTANPDIFRHRQSFPDVFNGDAAGIDWSPVEQLGDRFEIVRSGVIFKLYPCCGSTHAAIDAMLDLRSRDAIDPNQIERIEVLEHPRRLAHTNRPDPKTGLEAKFSVQYVVALAAMTGKVEMGDFDGDRLSDPELSRMTARVGAGHLPVEQQGPTKGRNDCFAATVRVHRSDGGVHELHVDGPRGSTSELPISDAELVRKFKSAAATSLGSAGAERAHAAVERWLEGSLATKDLPANLVPKGG